MKQREVISREEEINQLEQLDYSELDNPKLKVTAYGYVHAFEILLDYSKKRWMWSFVAGTIAGIFIGIGYITAAYCVYTIDNPAIQKLVLGTVFSTIIIPIYFIGGTFLTAYMSLTYPATKKIIRTRDLLKSFFAVYSGNIMGMFIVVLIAAVANIYHDPRFATFIFDAMGTHKMYSFGDRLKENTSNGVGLLTGLNAGIAFKSILYVFASAMLCTFFISLSAQAFKAPKEQYLAAMFMLFLVVAFFAIPGFQHCVANWFSLWSLLFLSAFHESAINGKVASSNIAGWFMLINIIPAIIGNLVGAFFMGYLLAYFNQPFSTLAFKRARLAYLKSEETRLTKHKRKEN